MRHCVTVPNFVKIGQTVAEIWRFDGFQNGGTVATYVASLVGVRYASLCWSRLRALQNRLNRSRCSLAGGLWRSKKRVSGGNRVARSPVFYGRSRISDPFSRLPGGGSGREEQISRIPLVRLSRHSDDTVTRENFV